MWNMWHLKNVILLVWPLQRLKEEQWSFVCLLPNMGNLKDLHIQYLLMVFSVMYKRELLIFKVSLMNNLTKLHLRGWQYGGLMDRWTANVLLMSSPSKNCIQFMSHYLVYLFLIHAYILYILLHYIIYIIQFKLY